MNAKSLTSMDSVGGGTPFRKTLHSKIRVEVSPDDGGPDFESAASAWGGDEQDLDVRNWTYVRYDPRQPAECELDGDRLEKEFGRSDGKRRTTVPRQVAHTWTKQKREEQRAEAAGSAPIAEAAHNAESAPGSDAVVAGLRDLVQMHAAGGLTDAEFAEAKSGLLQPG